MTSLLEEVTNLFLSIHTYLRHLPLICIYLHVYLLVLNFMYGLIYNYEVKLQKINFKRLR